MEWEFKKVNVGSLCSVQLFEVADSEKIKEYSSVLKKACSSKLSNPVFSNFHVLEGVGSIGHRKIGAGNIEYGFCQALHAEEFAVASFRAGPACRQAGSKKRGDEKVILGVVSQNEGEIPTPCGNCRDILLDEFGPPAGGLEIVTGRKSGGVATVTKLSHFLFDRFSKIPRASVLTLTKEGFTSSVWDALKGCGKIKNDPYSPLDVHPERRYFSYLVTQKNIYLGALDLMCDFHPIYPLRDSIRAALRAGDSYLEYIIVLGETKGINPPHVMYKDRQHLYELNFIQELIKDKQTNPPVYLVSQGTNRGISSVWKTSVKEWLPFPFSPKAFGEEFLEHLKNYYRTKIH